MSNILESMSFQNTLPEAENSFTTIGLGITIASQRLRRISLYYDAFSPDYLNHPSQPSSLRTVGALRT